MKRTILCLAIAFAATAGANELDRDVSNAPAITTALPKTTVIRVNNQTKEVEVVHLTSRLAAGQKVESAKFEKVAANTEIAGIKFDASNELDATSSTSSWAYRPRYYPRYYPNYYRPYYGYGNYNTGYAYNPYYYGNSYYAVNTGCNSGAAYYGAYNCNSAYYATYRVANYAYVAQPYYYYATPAYSYYYCGY